MHALINAVVYYPFLNILHFFIWLVPGHNVVWGIIGLTLLVRFILLIPSKHALEAQRKLTKLQPMMEQLKQEYGEDRNGLAMAQMELYRKNDINPFASCLPMLIQLPLLLILYYAIRSGLDSSGAHLYAWLPRPDHIATNFLGIDLAKPDRTYILPAVAALLQYWQMRMMMPNMPKIQTKEGEPDPAQMMSRYGQYFFPGMTFFVASGLAGAISVYWVVGNAFAIVQQHYVMKENLKLKGVEQELEKAEKLHPENVPASAEKQVVSSMEKQGVTVTVRKKK